MFLNKEIRINCSKSITVNIVGTKWQSSSELCKKEMISERSVGEEFLKVFCWLINIPEGQYDLIEAPKIFIVCFSDLMYYIADNPSSLRVGMLIEIYISQFFSCREAGMVSTYTHTKECLNLGPFKRNDCLLSLISCAKSQKLYGDPVECFMQILSRVVHQGLQR